MNEFDRRWRLATTRARQTSAPSAEAPPGFGKRVLAAARPAAPPVPADAWLRLGWRALAGASALLVWMAVWEWRDTGRSTLGMPHVEHAVTRAFWML